MNVRLIVVTFLSCFHRAATQCPVATSLVSQVEYTIPILSQPTVPVSIVMTGNVEGNPSLADLLSFMKNSEENRKEDLKEFEEKLKLEREKDKSDLANDISSLTTKLTDLVQTGIENGIVKAVKPLEEKQNSMLDEQTKLVQKVVELEKRLEVVAENKNPATERATATVMNAEVITHVGDKQVDGDDIEERRLVVSAAKKILGFSKISDVHIKQAIDEHEIDEKDEEKAKIYAVYDFLFYEMKIPENEVKNLKILRTFRSAKLSETDRLYAEFADQASVNYVNLFVRNLQPGTNVDIWIPPALFQRYRDFDHAKYLIRKGLGNFKAKIKYGEEDFILLKKSPACRSWTNVIPEKLSALNPSASTYVTMSSSPPLGRRSRSKRKARSPLNSSSDSKIQRADTFEQPESEKLFENDANKEVTAVTNTEVKDNFR